MQTKEYKPAMIIFKVVCRLTRFMQFCFHSTLGRCCQTASLVIVQKKVPVGAKRAFKARNFKAGKLA